MSLLLRQQRKSQRWQPRAVMHASWCHNVQQAHAHFKRGLSQGKALHAIMLAMYLHARSIRRT